MTDWTKSTNTQGDDINRAASQAGQSATQRAEDARMNAENAEAARQAQASGR